MGQNALNWEIYCGDPGNGITHFSSTPSEILEYCGRLLYGHDLFEIIFMRIRRVEANQPESLGGTYPALPDKAPNWIMHTLGNDGKIACRQLETKHELFAMIIADLRLGASIIEVRHITNASEEHVA